VLGETAPNAILGCSRVADNIADVLAPDGSYCLNIRAHCEDGQRHLYVMKVVIAHVEQT
jgi:hypothetical protein